MSSSNPAAPAGAGPTGHEKLPGEHGDTPREAPSEYSIRPVGFVRIERPARGAVGDQATSTIVLTEDFASDALAGLAAFSHAEIIVLFDRVTLKDIETGAQRPKRRPDWPLVGIFAQRDENRPNRLGVIIAEIVGVSGARLMLRGMALADGTPVVDIKPVIIANLPSGRLKQPKWADDWTRERTIIGAG